MFYIDEGYKCHTSNPDGIYRAIDKDLFEGKCDIFIEGYMYVPSGETWMREDGTVFHGEMFAPWIGYDLLEAAQNQYEADLADAAAAYQEGVNTAYDQ